MSISISKLTISFFIFVSNNSLDSILNPQSSVSYGNSANVNAYLWRASLNILSFTPLISTDALGGTIISDWYVNKNNKNQENQSRITNEEDHTQSSQSGIYLRDDHCDWGSSGMNEFTNEFSEDK